MGDLLNQITSFLGGIWDSPVVQLGLRATAIYVVILWLAGAYWAFRDMQLRTANPILPYFAASLVILFTPIFFVFAIVAYRIVRPQEKIGEVYERTLAEEALLAEVEAVKSCPTCARRVNEEWIICPTCRTRLNRVCPNCSRLVGLDWSLCAWCGRDFERAVPGFEAIAAPRQGGPAESTFARPGATPALDAAYGTAGASAGGGRESALQPGRRQAAPLADRTAMTSAYEAAPGPARSLDRAPVPPTATRNAPPAPPARTARPPAARGPVKGETKGPRSSTDPLREH